VEKIHLNPFKETLKGSTDDSTKYYVCQTCGYIAVREIPPNCPVCNAVQEKFRLED
jgi:rubrerythrin